MKKNQPMSKHHIFSAGYWRQHDIDLIIGKLLRYGCYTACLIALLGGVMYMLQGGKQMSDYLSLEDSVADSFSGVALYLRELNTILPAILRLDGAAVIQLGVIVLIATPILRIAFSVFAFLLEKDYLYVGITLVVLSIIIANMIFGLH